MNSVIPVFAAVKAGDLDFLKQAIQSGLDVSQAPDSVTLLHVAAAQGHVNMIQLLLDAGVPVNAVNKNNITALLAAALTGHAAVVEILLRNGADPYVAADNDMTPLKAAIDRDHLDVKCLLESHDDFLSGDGAGGVGG